MSALRMNKKGNLCSRQSIPEKGGRLACAPHLPLDPSHSVMGWPNSTKLKRKITVPEEICYATKLLCFPVYCTWNYTDAVSIMIMHDAVRALHVKTARWKAKCDMKTLLSFHFVSPHNTVCARHQVSPQGWEIQFFNFLHIHLQPKWRACQNTDGKCWMNYPFTVWKHLQMFSVIKIKESFHRSSCKRQTPSEHMFKACIKRKKNWEHIG